MRRGRPSRPIIAPAPMGISDLQHHWQEVRTPLPLCGQGPEHRYRRCPPFRLRQLYLVPWIRVPRLLPEMRRKHEARLVLPLLARLQHAEKHFMQSADKELPGVCVLLRPCHAGFHELDLFSELVVHILQRALASVPRHPAQLQAPLAPARVLSHTAHPHRLLREYSAQLQAGWPLTERPDAQCLGQEHDLGDSRLSCRRPCLAPPKEVFFVLWDPLVAVRACSCGSEPPLVRPHRRPQGSRQGPP